MVHFSARLDASVRCFADICHARAGRSVRAAVNQLSHDQLQPEVGVWRVVGERCEPLANEEWLHGEASRRFGEELVVGRRPGLQRPLNEEARLRNEPALRRPR